MIVYLNKHIIGSNEIMFPLDINRNNGDLIVSEIPSIQYQLYITGDGICNTNYLYASVIKQWNLAAILKICKILLNSYLNNDPIITNVFMDIIMFSEGHLCSTYLTGKC